MDTSVLIRKHCQGFTITEIMVALLISSILMGGVITMLSSGKRTYALQSEMAELQDNARFVMEEFTRELRMGGFFGCSRTPPPGIAAGNPFQGSQDNLEIRDQTNTKKVDSSFPRSDTLSIVSFGESLSIPATTTLPFNSQQITLLPDSIPADISRPVIVSDCAGSNSYSFSLDGDNNIIVDPTAGFLGFRRDYLPPVDVFMGTTTVVYQVISTPGEGFALLKCEMVCNTLVEGVQNLQVRYGIEDSNNNNQIRYNTNTNPTDRVVSVRITWLMRTNKKRGIGEPPDKVYQLDPNVEYNPAKNKRETGYRHRLFSTTIKVRNN